MIADQIAAGHTALADVLYLVAVILFGLAAIVRILDWSEHGFDGALVAAGAALVALALFVT